MSSLLHCVNSTQYHPTVYQFGKEGTAMIFEAEADTPAVFKSLRIREEVLNGAHAYIGPFSFVYSCEMKSYLFGHFSIWTKSL